MVRERYLRQLDTLKESVSSFGKMVELIFRNSMVAVLDLDVKLAERVLASEAEINKLEEGIEVSIFDLLALQQPIARILGFFILSQDLSGFQKDCRIVNQYCRNSRKN